MDSGPQSAAAAPGAAAAVVGELRVSWDRDAERWRLRNTRTPAAARLLVGRTPGEVLVLVGALHGVCRTAQLVAAVRALEAAAGRESLPSVEHARDRLIAFEALREQLILLHLTVPAILGLEPDTETVAAVRRAEADAVARLGAVLAFGAAAGAAAEPAAGIDLAVAAAREHDAVPIDPDQLDGWLERGASLPARACRLIRDRGWAADAAAERRGLRAAELEEVAAALDDTGSPDEAAALASRPAVGGTNRETGAFARYRDHAMIAEAARRHGPGVLARLLAALVATANGLRQPEPRPAGLVETARGLLLHRAELIGGRVARYAILAPTEWNFHPDGAAVEGIGSLPEVARNDDGRRLRLAVAAYDPCIALAVEDGHA